MGTARSTDADADANADLDRRRFIRKAAIAGGAVWAVPTLVSMRPAGADELTSSPPVPPSSTEAPVAPASVPRPTPQAPPPQPPAGTGGSSAPQGAGGQTEAGSLARTGADIDKLTAAGLTTIAAGGALTYWSATRMRNLAPPTEPSPGATASPGGDDATTSLA